MKKTLSITLLLLLVFSLGQLKAQENETRPSLRRHVLSLNPLIYAGMQFNLAYDFRFLDTDAIGAELIYGHGYYGPYDSRRKVTRLELNSTTRAIRMRLRYKHYVFNKDPRKGIASMYLSPQLGYKRIKGLTLLEEQIDLGVLELTRTGLRFDMIFGADMHFGRFVLGYYVGGGMGQLREHRATTESGKTLKLFPEVEWIFDVGPRGGINIGFCF